MWLSCSEFSDCVRARPRSTPVRQNRRETCSLSARQGSRDYRGKTERLSRNHIVVHISIEFIVHCVKAGSKCVLIAQGASVSCQLLTTSRTLHCNSAVERRTSFIVIQLIAKQFVVLHSHFDVITTFYAGALTISMDPLHRVVITGKL